MTDKETLEEAAERWVFDTNGHKWSNNDDTAGDNYNSFIKGTKWQMERSYSEEELDLLNKMFNLYWIENNSQHEDNLEEWEFSKRLFEQFKKKWL